MYPLSFLHLTANFTESEIIILVIAGFQNSNQYSLHLTSLPRAEHVLFTIGQTTWVPKCRQHCSYLPVNHALGMRTATLYTACT